jgi:hypothetical protein
MSRHTVVAGLAGAFMAALIAAPGLLDAAPDPADSQQSRLAARAVLPGATFRASPPAGAYLSSGDRATAAANGVPGPATGAYFGSQPVQGFSSMVPAGEGTWWALLDNGFGSRQNSPDSQLAFYRIDPRWGDPAGPTVLETVVLSDPDGHIPWRIVCDQAAGLALPAFEFNVMPPAPPACGDDPSARILTGFDLDPESFVRARDGSFWIGDEFGPFLVHVRADGVLLERPVEAAGVRSPQNPYLDLSDPAQPEQPTVAASRGFEGVAISPNGKRLYALLEGAVADDDAQDLRIYTFDVHRRAFDARVMRVRAEMPTQKVNLVNLVDPAGARVYPEAVAPATGVISIGELKAVNDHELLLVERDGQGDGVVAPRFKKVMLLDLAPAGSANRHVRKTLLVDLMAVPDPRRLGQDGEFFRFPFNTIESVHVVDARTILVASDNNFPFSNGRARSRTNERTGPLAFDDNEMILVRLGTPLKVDARLLPPG